MDTKQQLVNAPQAWAQLLPKLWMSSRALSPGGHPALTVSNALVALDADDDAALAQQLETVEGFIDHVSENRGVAASSRHRGRARGSQSFHLLAAIREVGALMQTAGVKNTQVNEWVYRSLRSTRQLRRKGSRAARRKSRH